MRMNIRGSTGSSWLDLVCRGVLPGSNGELPKRLAADNNRLVGFQLNTVRNGEQR